MNLTRTEKWPLILSAEYRNDVQGTVKLYQRYVRALVSVCITHWPHLGRLSSMDAMRDIEHMIHPTKKRPEVKYAYFNTVFYKFPSYLRRSAIHDAMGQASSFLMRYDQWQTGESRKSSLSKQPTLGVGGSYPSLYKGQCIKYADDLSSAQIKVFRQGDWQWINIKIKHTGKRAADIDQKRASAQLVCTGKKAYLAVPHQRTVTLHKSLADVVCSVDLGINTSITASIVRSDGTVLARKFINRASDIDRIHKGLTAIAKSAKKTKKLCKGFSSKRHKKASNRAKNSAHQMTRELVDFAAENGATTIVFEHMKGWRPKGPRKGLKQKFHTWLHRRVVEFTEWKWRECSGRIAFVSPRNTSKYAYDGSGEVTRSIQENYSICRFKNGKIYNADLNPTYNIAAKYFLRSREADRFVLGKSPDMKQRIPETLSMLWGRSSPQVVA